MRTRLLIATHFVALILLSFTSAFRQITPSQDAFTNSVSPSTNYGANVLLDVSSAKEIAYVQFDLASIPAGADISQATLKLYINAATTSGSFNADYVNGSWGEGTITHSLAPALSGTIVSNISITTSDKNQYILVDITPALEAWVNGSMANDGIALVANGSFSASFDSKENKTTSHPAELDVVFAGSGTITGVLTGSQLSRENGWPTQSHDILHKMSPDILYTPARAQRAREIPIDATEDDGCSRTASELCGDRKSGREVIDGLCQEFGISRPT